MIGDGQFQVLRKTPFRMQWINLTSEYPLLLLTWNTTFIWWANCIWKYKRLIDSDWTGLKPSIVINDHSHSTARLSHGHLNEQLLCQILCHDIAVSPCAQCYCHPCYDIMASAEILLIYIIYQMVLVPISNAALLGVMLWSRPHVLLARHLHNVT